MATTIITKNGSGAPLAGDLTAGELAVDLTNKRLYSKDSGGNVIELGTNAGSSTFADLTVSGDLTVDTNTLYVDSTNNAVGINTVTASGPQSTFHIEQNGDDADGGFRLSRDNALASYTQYINTSSTWNLAYGNPSSDDSPTDIISVTTSGNVGIGTSSPDSRLTIEAPTGDYAILLTPSGDTTGTVTTSYIGFDVRSSTVNGPEPAAYIGVEESSVSSVQGELVFATRQTNNSTVAPTEAMRIDSSGNVGIGRTPSYVLDVEGDATPIFALRSNSNTGSSLMFFGRPNDVDAGRIGYDHTNDLMYFRTAGSEAMRITSGGNVGIGLTSPQRTMHLNGGATRTDVQLTLDGFGEGASNGVQFGTLSTGAYIWNFENTELYFGTNNTRRVTIDSSGNLLVGTSGYVDFKQRVQQTANLGVCALVNTLSSGLTYDQFQILVQNAASSGFFFQRFYAAGGTQQFGVTGNGVIYAQNTSVQSISDARVKENVRDSEQGLDVITALRPVRFDFKEGFGNDQKNQLGFIAQEVEAVFPDAVMEASEKVEGEEPLKSLGPAALIPVMVKAIQEQQAMIETLQAQVAELQGAN